MSREKAFIGGHGRGKREKMGKERDRPGERQPGQARYDGKKGKKVRGGKHEVKPFKPGMAAFRVWG